MIDKDILAKRKGSRKFKRQMELRRRIRCHGNTEKCMVAHPPRTRMKIKSKVEKLSWWIRFKLLIKRLWQHI